MRKIHNDLYQTFQLKEIGKEWIWGLWDDSEMGYQVKIPSDWIQPERQGYPSSQVFK